MLLSQEEYQKEISKLFFDEIERKPERNIGRLEIEIEEGEINTEVKHLGNDSNFTNLGQMVNSVGSVSEIISPKNEDTSTMHTLKSEFEYFQRYSIPNLNESEKLNFDDEKLNNSFDYSVREDSDQESQEFENVEKLTFYFPPEKENEQLHKTAIKNLSSVIKSNSDFVDLSGKLHPAPSFLYDESIGEMIAKEEREDIRKSSILKQSIHLSESSKKSLLSGGEKKYTANLRAIKYQNKLRKGSKQSVGTKRNVAEMALEKENKNAKGKEKEERLINEEEEDEEVGLKSDGKRRVSFIGEGDSDVKMFNSEVSHNPREKSKFFKFKNVPI